MHPTMMREIFFSSLILLISSKLHEIVGHQNIVHSGYVHIIVAKTTVYYYQYSLQKNGKEISWGHLVELYYKDKGKGSGLAMVPKLKLEHLQLTSFSKMRVDLAAQVKGIKLTHL